MSLFNFNKRRQEQRQEIPADAEEVLRSVQSLLDMILSNERARAELMERVPGEDDDDDCDCLTCDKVAECFSDRRRDIIQKTGDKVCKFAFNKGISRIAFLDRAARGGATVVEESWKKNYPETTPPPANSSQPTRIRSS